MGCIAPTMVVSAVAAPGRCGDTCVPGAPFCATHAKADPGKKGGWISAERRRRQRAGEISCRPGELAAAMSSDLDASSIARRLWIGGKPPLDRHLPGFDVLALCARELQPATVGFRGVVLRPSLPDSQLTQAELDRALANGREVAYALLGGKTVLVTCAMGRNRSALVAALGLGLITKLSATDLVELMRRRRSPECLSNPHFVSILHRFIGEGRARTLKLKRRP